MTFARFGYLLVPSGSKCGPPCKSHISQGSSLASLNCGWFSQSAWEGLIIFPDGKVKANLAGETMLKKGNWEPGDLPGPKCSAALTRFHVCLDSSGAAGENTVNRRSASDQVSRRQCRQVRDRRRSREHHPVCNVRVRRRRGCSGSIDVGDQIKCAGTWLYLCRLCHSLILGQENKGRLTFPYRYL